MPIERGYVVPEGWQDLEPAALAAELARLNVSLSETGAAGVANVLLGVTDAGPEGSGPLPPTPDG